MASADRKSNDCRAFSSTSAALKEDSSTGSVSAYGREDPVYPGRAAGVSVDISSLDAALVAEIPLPEVAIIRKIKKLV